LPFLKFNLPSSVALARLPPPLLAPIRLCLASAVATDTPRVKLEFKLALTAPKLKSTAKL